MRSSAFQQGNRPINAELPTWPAYVAIGLSGLTAIGAEVVWTRLLSLMLGGTVYTFSIILAVFLFGLGIGSSVGAVLARNSLRPGILLGWCQFVLMGAIFWTAYMLAESLPYWPINQALTANAWLDFQLDMVRCLWALLPATLLWGASFPLALAAAARGQDPARLVGGVYAANTVGGILGGIGFSIIFIPWIGTQQSQRLLIGLAAAAALVMFVAAAWQFWKRTSLAAVVLGGILGGVGFGMIFISWFGTQRGRQLLIGLAAAAALLMFVALAWQVWRRTSLAAVVRGILRFAALVLFTAAVVFSSAALARYVAAVPGELVAWGRHMPTKLGVCKIRYVGEGMNNSVAVSEEFTAAYTEDDPVAETEDDSAAVTDDRGNAHLQFPHQRQDRGLQRAAGHAVAALAGAPSGAGACAAALGAGCRLRGGRDGRDLHAVSGHRDNHDL